ncbi:MAG: flavin monoamine oxidase family protein [Cyclobacteriaceae bacterium]
MKRRKALKQIGIGLSAGMFMPQFLASCKKENAGPEIPFNGNVIVIGAGAAGLYAADILRIKGINVTVLEAASQPGGRVRSLRNQTNVQYQTFSTASQADFPVELGAEIIYGSDSSWGKIVSDLRIPTNELSLTAPRYILGNTAKSSADLLNDNDFKDVQSFVNGLPNFSGGGSIKDAAPVSAQAQALLNSLVGNFYGSSIDRIGASGLAESLKLIKHDNKQLVTQANPWQDVLISRFSEMLAGVQFNTVVKSIDWGSDVVTITDSNGKQYTAKKVIVTIPLASLKSGGIGFNPVLPASTTSAMANFGMDASVRMVLDFKKNFWGNDSSFLWGGSTVPQYFNAGVSRSKFYRTMSLTIYGQKALQLSSLPDDYNRTLQVLAELDTIYAGQGTQYIRRDLDNSNNATNILSLVKDWGKDEFTKGGFSYPLVGATLQHRKDLAAPLSDKLFFAGEATDFSGDAGSVSGALNSAVRVAEEVVKSITG